MPSHEKPDRARRIYTGFRNTARFLWSGMPTTKKQRLTPLARRGLSPTVHSELVKSSTGWVAWATKTAKKSDYSGPIRVKAHKILTNKANAKQSFVGIGLDENVPTEMLKLNKVWKGMTTAQAEDIFNNRSRTSDLIWRNEVPNPKPAPGKWEPISGHTPGFKQAVVKGTTSALTKEHDKRNTARKKAVEKTLSDPSSPSPFDDAGVMSSLATIKFMASPSTELMQAKSDIQAMPKARYSALTGNKDLRQSAHFDDFVAHVQEARERQKWEVASVMKGDTRLALMVPPVINSYLGTFGNDPLKAMESFRYDLHKAWVGPPVNTATTSDTKKSFVNQTLHEMAEKTRTTGRRQRSLSDARWLPPTSPVNSRGQ